jgi:hypothetical protein
MQDIKVQLSEFEDPRTVKAPVFGWQDLDEPVQFGEVLVADFGDLLEARKAASKALDGGLVREINEMMDHMDAGAPMAFLRATSDLQNPCHPLNVSATNPSGEDHATLRVIKLGEFGGREVTKAVKKSLANWAQIEAAGVIEISGEEFDLEYAGLDAETGKGIPRRPGVCPTCKAWAEGQTRGRKASKGRRGKAATGLGDYRDLLAKRRNQE